MTRVEGLPVSVQVRLARHARAIGMDPNLVLARFALERFLYRLSRSGHADRFVLKGALMMLVWLGETIADIEGKRAQWSGFVRRNRLDAAPADLASAVVGNARFVGPVLAAAARGRVFAGSWPPGGPWRSTEELPA